MNLWLKVVAISAVLCAVASDDDDCGKLLDGFASCVIKIKKDKDVQTLLSKKLDIVKDCGATEANIKCFKSTHECIGKATDKVEDSSERKQSMSDAADCWKKEPKNPFAGMEELFHGLSEFVGSHHPPPPGPPPGPGPWSGDGPPPPGAVNAPLPPPPKDGPPPKGPLGAPRFMGDMPHPRGPPPPFPLPDDCKSAIEDRSIMNCTFSKVFESKDLLGIIKTLRDKLQDCKKPLPPMCHPKGPGVVGCLLEAYKPTIKLAVSTYKECMDKGGYKIPDGPLDNLPETGASSDSNSTSHDFLFF